MTKSRHDRAALTTDAGTLRDCAGRLEALIGQLPEGLPSGEGADWSRILAALAKRCRVAAAELQAAAARYGEDADLDGAVSMAAAGGLGPVADSLLRLSALADPRNLDALIGLAKRAWPQGAADPAAAAFVRRQVEP